MTLATEDQDHAKRRMMTASNFEKRSMIPIFLVFLILFSILFAPRLNSDGAYYYEFLRSIVIQNDLNFDDEREFYTWEWVPVFRSYLPGDWENTGYPPNIFSIGPALAWSPGYILVHSGIRTLNLLGCGLPADGYGIAYRFGATIISVIAGLLTLIFLNIFLSDIGFENAERSPVLILLLCATHWPAFIFVTPAFAHAISVCIVTAFVTVWYRFPDTTDSISKYAMYGCLGGAAILTRWQNILFLLLPAVDAVADLTNRTSLKKTGQWLLKWLIFCAMLVLTISPQLITTRILYGKYITDPQGEGGMHWLIPKFITVLFWGVNGLFALHPILLLAILFLPLIFISNRRAGWGLTLIFILQLYINAVRRDPFGVGFGLRRFLNCIPVFAAGFACVYQLANRKTQLPLRLGYWGIITFGYGYAALLLQSTLRFSTRYNLSFPVKWILPVTILVCLAAAVIDSFYSRPTLRKGFFWILGLIASAWNLLLMGQYYYSRLGAPWTKLTRNEMFALQLDESPQLLLNLIKESLLGKVMTGHPLYFFWYILGICILCLCVYVVTAKIQSVHAPITKIVLIAVIIFLVIWDLRFLSSDRRARTYYAVNLLPDKTFGALRKLRLNPTSGYLGSPGGLTVGPGSRYCRMTLIPEYDKTQFLNVGRLNIVEDLPCQTAETFTIDVPPNTFQANEKLRVNHMVLISTVTQGDIPTGTVIALIRIRSSSGNMFEFPVRMGMDTDWNHISRHISNTEVLVRNYPAIQKMAADGIVDTRQEYTFPYAITVDKIQIVFRRLSLEWKIHGIAFY
ncbi:hypothetical protein JW979_08045 [bacterium]|nr:hypothetical protein [candidate division CSSED10-310 bacterium]